jgi:hypothetical protein
MDERIDLTQDRIFRDDGLNLGVISLFKVEKVPIWEAYMDPFRERELSLVKQLLYKDANEYIERCNYCEARITIWDEIDHKCLCEKCQVKENLYELDQKLSYLNRSHVGFDIMSADL